MCDTDLPEDDSDETDSEDDKNGQDISDFDKIHPILKNTRVCAGCISHMLVIESPPDEIIGQMVNRAKFLQENGKLSNYKKGFSV